MFSLDTSEGFEMRYHSVLKVDAATVVVMVELENLIWEHFLRFQIFSQLPKNLFFIQVFFPENNINGICAP